MYCFFQTNSTNLVKFTEMARPGQQMYPAQAQVLNDADDLRNQIIKGDCSLIPQYLDFHVKIKQLLKYIGLYHPFFTYQSLISQIELQTTAFDCEEALEIDYVMMVYAYCCYQVLSCIEEIGKIRAKVILGQFANQNDVEYILLKMKQGYGYLQTIKLQSLQLLPRLSARQIFEIPEFSSQFFIQFHTYYTVLANLFHFEKEFELTRRQNLCSTMYKLLANTSGNDRMSIYFKYLKIYFKGLGFKCIVDKYQYNIDKEIYAEKCTIFQQLAYTIMTLEIIQICKELLNIVQFIQMEVLDEDYLDSFKQQSKLWVPFANEKIRVYTGIHHQQQPIDKNETIFLKCGYFNCLDK